MALSNTLTAASGKRVMTLGTTNAITITYLNGDLVVDRTSDGVRYEVRDRSNFDRFIDDLYTAFDEETP